MEVEDESIATAGYGKLRMDHHRTVDTAMSSSSMLSVETHPPSSKSNNNNNPFSYQASSSDTVDSRHDSPKEDPEDDSDAMMTEDAQIDRKTARIVTGEGAIITRVSTFREEKVSLAPRFGKLERSTRDQLDKEGEEGQHDPGMFSLSGSMSSEFLESQQQHEDHQQEYLDHPNRLTVGMNSPTSTTARDFLREVQCPPPPLPNYSGERDGNSRTGRASPAYPLHQRFGGHQRPPFHPPSGGSASNYVPTSSPNLPQFPSLSHATKSSSHPTLPREHTPNASSPASTNTIPGLGSFNCDRDKPVISRCFAWSQDSQDDRRITKRARTMATGMTSSASSPLSTDGVMSPSSALETIRGSAASSSKNALEDRSSEIPGNHSNPSSASPTKVHWEEKVEHSNELMSHAAVDPQVLFGATSAIQIATSSNRDVAMGNTEEGDAQQQGSERIPPPIATAQSASHYSFDSL